MDHELLSKLAEPFDPAIVSWRVGPTTQDKKKGMALAYIDARDVMTRLDAVCGPGDWQNDYPWGDGKRVVCRIGIKIGTEWVWKGDGAGDTDTEGEKGALSDAFKRAAVKWGIGRYLYDTQSPWVAIEPAGKSFKIADSEFTKLRACLPKPGGYVAPKSPAPEGASSVPGTKPSPSAQGRETPGKFELLDADGKIAEAYESAEMWCHGLREAITAEGARVAALWQMNATTAQVIYQHYPDVVWAGKTGRKVHAVELLEAKVNQLLPGLAA